MESTLKPALQLTLGRITAFAATFLIPVVLARVFEPAQFGTYKQIFLVYSTFALIAQFGMAESLYYFLSADRSKQGRYVANSVAALTLMGSICFAALAAGGHRISIWLSNEAIGRYTVLLGLYFLLMLASSNLEIVMVARKRFKLASASYALSDILRAALFIGPVLVFRSLEGLMVGAVLQAMVRCVALAVYTWRDFQAELHPDWCCFKDQLRYAIPFGLAVLAAILQSNFHQYAVSHYFDAATFAVYSVGCLQVPIVDFVATPMGTVMMVRIGEQIRDGVTREVLPIFHDTSRKLALLFFPLAGLLLVNARDIIVLLFTERYAGSVPIFMIWSLAILFATLPTDGVLRAYAQTRFLLLLSTLGLALVAGVIGWFLAAFQLRGAVVVTIIALAVSKTLALYRITTLMGVRMRRLLPWRNLAATLAIAGAACAPAMAVRAGLNLPPYLALVAVSSVYAASYCAFVLSFGLLNNGEKLAMASLLRRVSFRCVESQE